MAREGRRKISKTAHKTIHWLIAVYIRLSKEDGEDESLSVVNQRKIIEEYIEKTFEGEDYEIIDYYIDDGKTGTDYERPGFQRLMGDMENGRVNCFICKNLARAFRNYSDQGYFLESFFPRHGARFISIGSPQVDTYTNPEIISGMEVPITGLMNDRYAAKTSEDVRRTFNTKRRKGEFIGAFAPYGYIKDPEDKNKLIIDEEAASVVRDVFNWYVHESFSKRGIAKRLNELGIPNPTSYKRSKGMRFHNPSAHKNDGLWSPKTIHDILGNRMYLGHMVQGKQKVVSYKVHDKINQPEEQWIIKENSHKPLISQSLFDRAQELSARDTRTSDSGKTVHLFSGLLRCADCHKAMQRSHSRNHVYLICRTNSEKAKCTRHAIREDTLENVVLVSIQKQISLVDQLTEMMEAIKRKPVAKTQMQRLETMLASRFQEYQKVHHAMDSLYMDWKGGDITRSDYKRMKEKFDSQLLQLKQVIASLEQKKKQFGDGLSTDHPVFRSFLLYKNITKLERSILSALVDAIYIGKNQEVMIQFKYADQFQFALEYLEKNNAQ